MNSMSEYVKTKNQFNKRTMESQKGLKFACILNKNGRVSEIFHEDNFDIDEKSKEMLFMETVLQANMGKDFDGDLGKLQCNVTERANGLKYISTPLASNKIVFAVMDKQKDHNVFVKKIMCIQKYLDVSKTLE